MQKKDKYNSISISTPKETFEDCYDDFKDFFKTWNQRDSLRFRRDSLRLDTLNNQNKDDQPTTSASAASAQQNDPNDQEQEVPAAIRQVNPKIVSL